jgi:hypothetical protein
MENRYKYIDEKKEHMHTLDGKPLFGTSTIVKIISKPLTWWASGMAVGKLGWTNSKLRINGKYQTVPLEERLRHCEEYFAEVKELTTERYLELLDDAYRAHDDTKKEAGVKGTDRHALLEEYVKRCIEKNEGLPLAKVPERFLEVMSFVTWAQTNVKKFLWSEANCYSEVLWTGGIADVGWLDHEDRIIAGDFKSSKEAFFDQFLQIAGYDTALTENGGLDKDGNELFRLPGSIKGYCVVPFGAEKPTPNLQYDVESYKEGFKSALTLHKLQVSFNNSN